MSNTKGHLGENWSSMFGERSEWANQEPLTLTARMDIQPKNPSSQYTTISFSLYWNMVEGQMDIQVEALEGYTNRAVDPARAHILWTVYKYTFYGEESGWSNTQTVTIGGSVSTYSPNPTSSSNPTTTLTSTPTTTNSTGNPISVPLNTLIVVVAVFVSYYCCSVTIAF